MTQLCGTSCRRGSRLDITEKERSVDSAVRRMRALDGLGVKGKGKSKKTDAALDGAESALSSPRGRFLPDAYTVSALNPATSYAKGGVRPLQQLIPFRKSEVDVVFSTSSSGGLVLRTRNVARFEVAVSAGAERNDDFTTPFGVLSSLAAAANASDSNTAPAGALQLDESRIDGEALVLALDQESSSFCFVRANWPHGTSEWVACAESILSVDGGGKKGKKSKKSSKATAVPVSEYQRVERGPDNLGPARRVVDSPFIIVVGTQFEDLGSNDENDKSKSISATVTERQKKQNP